MSTPPSEELDKTIQLCLVTRIREAARAYRTATAGSSMCALEVYLAALETLADYVGSQWRFRGDVPNIAHARQRLHTPPPATNHGTARIIPFAPPSAKKKDSPVPAA